MDKERVAPGEIVVVSAELKNDNNFTVTKTVTLRVDNKVKASQEVTVAPGQSKTLTFEIILEEPGEHTITMEGATVLAIVEGGGGGANWLLISLIVVLILAVAAGVGVVGFRRYRGVASATNPPSED